MTIAAISGHRPEKIDDPDWVREALTETFQLLGVTHVIQGMAAGVDLWSARVAYKLGIPYTCAKPWAGHKPRNADAKDYALALRHAQRVYNVEDSLTYPGVWVYQKRNKWMIDNGEFLISVWDGSESGGTWNAVEHAEKVGKTIFNCNPKKKVCDFLVSSVI